MKPERPVKLLLGFARRRDVNGQEKFLEVDVAILVGIKGAKHVVAKLVGVSCGEALAVDQHEGLGGEPSVGAIALESAVPLFDGVLVVPGGRLEELEVVFAQSLFTLLLSHVSLLLKLSNDELVLKSD